MPWTDRGTPQSSYTPVDPYWGLQGSGRGNVLVPTQEMIGISREGKAQFTCPPNSPEAIEIAALCALRAGLTGAHNEFLRMMIDNRMAAIRGSSVRAYKKIGDLLPDWMKPYIQEGTAYEQPEGLDFGRYHRSEPRSLSRKGVSEGGGKLRPLGAQEKLTVEQQQFLSGYLAWAKAGQPSGRGFGGVSSGKNRFLDLIQQIAASQGSQWAEYTRKAQSVFPPSQRLGVQKRIASQ